MSKNQNTHPCSREEWYAVNFWNSIGTAAASLMICAFAFLQAASAASGDTDVSAWFTSLFVTGLLFRPQRRIARMGVDSLVVLLLYLIGVAGLFAV